MNMPAAFAQPPEIVIGQSAGYTGRTSSSVKEFMEGAQAFFEVVNKRGGAAGRKIYLTTLDDGYLPELVAENSRRLIDDEKALAPFGYFGDAPVNIALPLIKEKKIPLVAAVTGAEAHRSHPNLYFVRASYQVEVEKIVAQSAAQGLNKFAIFYQNGEFGKDVLAGLQKALALRKLTLAGEGVCERNSVKVDEGMRDVDLGGFVVNFAGANRRGSDFADVTIIGLGGRIEH